ncbi:MAG: site-specific integrase [Cyclobacteriaceae bacterium]
MRSELSIKIYRHSERGKGSRHQLYVRLTHQRKKAEVATKFYLEEREWDAAKERAKSNSGVNSELAEMESRLRSIKQQLEYDNQEVSAKRIKDIFSGRDTVDEMLLNSYKEYVDNLQHTSNLSTGTIKTYKKTYNLVKDFVEKQYSPDLRLKRVDLAFIESFHRYMSDFVQKSGEKLKNNTKAKHHSRFRTFLIHSMNHDRIQANPYKKYKLKFEESDRIFLTREELERFETCDLGGNKSLERIRDVFIFSTYTGMRFGDAQKLKMSDLIKSNEKNYFCHKEQKTGKHAQLPILPRAQQIIDKYSDSPERSLGIVLPKISNQKCNTYLKVIANLAKIFEKSVSHHVARHTCATTILLENGVPLEIVQAWLNHSNIRETMIYARMTSRAVNQSANVEALFEKFAIN